MCRSFTINRLPLFVEPVELINALILQEINFTLTEHTFGKVALVRNKRVKKCVKIFFPYPQLEFFPQLMERAESESTNSRHNLLRLNIFTVIYKIEERKTMFSLEWKELVQN